MEEVQNNKKEPLFEEIMPESFLNCEIAQIQTVYQGKCLKNW